MATYWFCVSVTTIKYFSNCNVSLEFTASKNCSDRSGSFLLDTLLMLFLQLCPTSTILQSGSKRVWTMSDASCSNLSKIERSWSLLVPGYLYLLQSKQDGRYYSSLPWPHSDRTCAQVHEPILLTLCQDLSTFESRAPLGCVPGHIWWYWMVNEVLNYLILSTYPPAKLLWQGSQATCLARSNEHPASWSPLINVLTRGKDKAWVTNTSQFVILLEPCNFSTSN